MAKGIPKSTFERAVTDIAEDVKRRPSTTCWSGREESQLWYELVACLLGSRVSFELAQASARSLYSSGVLNHASPGRVIPRYSEMVFSVLSEPVRVESCCGSTRQIRYRFPRARAEGIARTAEQIYCSAAKSIRSILEESCDSRHARRSVVEASHGVGAKQASLFLRNIGYSNDVAILDSHILRYMRIVGITERTLTSVSGIGAYEQLESDLCSYADDLGFPVWCLDTAVWIVMRVHQREFAK